MGFSKVTIDKQRLAAFLGLSRRQIGQLGPGRARTGGIVDLATPQTLARRDNPAEVFAGYGLVIVDECHHLPVASFEQAVRQAPNRRWIGLTATPRRRDGLEAILHMQLGPIRHTMRTDPAATVMVRRDLIVHDTLTDPDVDEQTAVQVMLGKVAADPERNEQISADVADAYRRGRNTLVFTDRIDHLERIRDGLSRHGLDPAVLQGGTAKKKRTAIIEALHATTDPILLLATGAYLGASTRDPNVSQTERTDNPMEQSRVGALRNRTGDECPVTRSFLQNEGRHGTGERSMLMLALTSTKRLKTSHLPALLWG